MSYLDEMNRRELHGEVEGVFGGDSGDGVRPVSSAESSHVEDGLELRGSWIDGGAHLRPGVNGIAMLCVKGETASKTRERRGDSGKRRHAQRHFSGRST